MGSGILLDIHLKHIVTSGKTCAREGYDHEVVIQPARFTRGLDNFRKTIYSSFL